MKWQEKAREIQREDKCELESLKGAYIVRAKFTIEAQEKIMNTRQGFTMDDAGVPQNIKKGELKRFHKVVLTNGILDHNFENDKGEKEELGDEFFEELFTYPDIESEIFKKILEFNRPLAEESGSVPENALSGLSGENDSNLELSSQTDVSPT